jgi:methylated-DNA-[protein]-cysteine S-methyltransferase
LTGTGKIFFWDSLESSQLGRIDLSCSEDGLTSIQFHGVSKTIKSADHSYGHSILAETKKQILAYMQGSLQSFNLPIDWSGMTCFARSVRLACLKIPFGETVTYSQLAELAGFPGKARAVGNINALNPIPLIIPCHRVIGKDGKLHGYAGPDGVKTKQWLLDGERNSEWKILRFS